MKQENHDGTGGAKNTARLDSGEPPEPWNRGPSDPCENSRTEPWNPGDQRQNAQREERERQRVEPPAWLVHTISINKKGPGPAPFVLETLA